MPFSALLDANVLVPNVLRDTLLRVAEDDLYRPLWSREILAETRRTILRLRPEVNAERLDAMFVDMNDTFVDAMVTGHDSLISDMGNDEGDRHVLAAAITGRADVIITNNVKDFPASAVDPLHIEVMRPDRFLCLQFDLSPSLVIDVLRRQSADTGRAPGKPRLALDDLLELLRRSGAPTFASQVLAQLPAALPRSRSPHRTSGAPTVKPEVDSLPAHGPARATKRRTELPSPARRGIDASRQTRHTPQQRQRGAVGAELGQLGVDEVGDELGG
ncbi:putative toxin-antitoxin system toxin component, PIN family [Micromonospora sp. NPDC005252]|uniref:PIN domain-containing protein n=1 Tax=Micromonospora sp. NPDC005252 TaxID=3364228 RepID=UPI003690C375